MTKRLNIPDALNGPFSDLIQLLPYNLQNDIEVQNTIIVYLKLGGEKMARHGIDTLRMLFQQEIQDDIEVSSSPDVIDSDVETNDDLDADDDDDDDEYSDSDYLDDDEDDEDDYSIDY